MFINIVDMWKTHSLAKTIGAFGKRQMSGRGCNTEQDCLARTAEDDSRHGFCPEQLRAGKRQKLLENEGWQVF